MDSCSSVGSSADQKSHNLFEVYLRLRPPQAGAASTERFITVEPPASDSPSTAPTHITLNPPNDRRRAIEKFAFTQVFEEDATQLDVFHCTNIVPLVEGVLAPHGGDGTDALLATLGVSGSGKSHTILGSRTQRGLAQLSLDVIFRSMGKSLVDIDTSATVGASIMTSDASEATISSASAFIDTVYGDLSGQPRPLSRAQTPLVGDQSSVPPTPRRLLNRPSALPQAPDISTVNVPCDPAAEYAVLISMYEVYNDRIFDLLTPPAKSVATKELRRRPLIFKSTELSPDRKVVAGLRKVLCSNLNQALMVLEAGLHERRVAGTGSNSVSSRSHGFFSIEVKKRPRSSSKRYSYAWGGSTLTIVDLAGSERARDAKTAGATLAEAGKINESLMYLGQCLQMQSEIGSNNKASVVPFRQCKLTELLFSNSFPSPSLTQSQPIRRNPQRAVMIVTADPHGDFNATSQILRYSALAREVTVPRIPSITESILQTNAAHARASGHSACRNSSHGQPCSTPTEQHQRLHFFPPGPLGQNHHRTPSPVSPTSPEDRVMMESAALEIARLAEETNYLRGSLAREREARVAAEAHLLSMEDKMLELEQAVREDCVAEFEKRLAVELARWKAGMQMSIERGEDHWDRKMEVFERGLGLHEEVDASDDGGPDNKENILVENLEEENARLRREVTILKRELAGRSPSKRVPLAERDDITASVNGSPRSGGSRHASYDENVRPENLQRRMESLSLREGQDDLRRVASVNNTRANSKSRGDGTGSAAKRVRSRKLTAKRWEGGFDDGDDVF